MAYTNFTCRSGGSNLNAGALDGVGEASTAPLVTYTNGGWNSGTGVFTPASGNPVAAGVAAGQFVSLFPTTTLQTFSGGSGTIPAGWDQQWGVAGVTWAENVGGFLRASVTGAGKYALRYTVAQGLQEVEVTGKIRTDTAPTGSQFFGGFVFGGSGAAGSESGRVWGLYSAAGFARTGVGTYSAGALSLNQLTSNGTATWSANNWFQIRVQWFNGGVRWKIWPDGSGEPGTWDTEVYQQNNTNVTGTTGWVAAWSTGVGTMDFDDVNVNILSTKFVARVTNVSTTTITASLTANSGTVPTTAASGVTAIVGGAWQGPNVGSGFPLQFFNTINLTNANGDYTWTNFKNDQQYNITANMTCTAAGILGFQGYTATLQDGGKAILDGGVVGASYFLMSLNNQNIVRDFIFQNNGATGNQPALGAGGGRVWIERCVFRNTRGPAIQITGGVCNVEECEAYSCVLSGLGSSAFDASGSNVWFLRCMAHDNTAAGAIGFGLTGASCTIEECAAWNNNGAGINVSAANGRHTIRKCDSYNNGSHGLTSGTTGNLIHIENSNFLKNGGYGVNNVWATTFVHLDNCGFGQGSMVNTSGPTNGVNTSEVLGTVMYGAGLTPWVNPAAGDFRLNTTPNAGLLARGAGRGAFMEIGPGLVGTVSYPDIGSNQHLDPPLGSTVGCSFIAGKEGGDMSVQAGQTVVVEFITSNPLTQAAVNADSLPTGTVVVAGVDNIAVVTIANVDAGRYKATFTVPAMAVGDIVELYIAATVNGTAGKSIVWRGAHDLVVDSSGRTTDVASVAANGIVNSVTPTPTSFQTSLAQQDHFWEGATLVFTSGVLAGQARTVTGFTNLNGVVTFDEALTAAPAQNDVFLVKSNHQHTRRQTADAVLGRNLAGGSDGGRMVKDSLRAGRNKISFDVPVAGQFTVYAEDDATPAWTGTYTRGSSNLGPLTVTDPA